MKTRGDLFTQLQRRIEVNREKQQPDNTKQQAGAPMTFLCEVCQGDIVVPEDYLIRGKLCQDCLRLEKEWNAMSISKETLDDIGVKIEKELYIEDVADGLARLEAKLRMISITVDTSSGTSSAACSCELAI